jgi:predicted nucleotidyltransferase
MLYVKTDRPVEPIVVAVLREFDRVAKDLTLPYFLAGAMSRDILLSNVFGNTPARATRDVDFAIAVADWAQFDALKKQFIDTGKFKYEDNIAHRLHYIPEGQEHSYALDIIPFRGVEAKTNIVAWRPDMKVMMNVSGYEEALESAVHVQIEDGLNIRVASLPGLALLKLFAWVDRGNETSKDAEDLVTLLRNYSDAGNQDRLYGEEGWALEETNYDLELAGSRLLGYDVCSIASQTTLKKIVALLNDGKMVERLTTNMARGLRGFDDGFAVATKLLEEFKARLLEQK